MSDETSDVDVHHTAGGVGATGSACVVFDLDGVIVASEYLWEEGWAHAARSRGAEWTARDTSACQGSSVGEWSDYVAERTGLSSSQARDHVISYVTGVYDSGVVDLLPGAADMVRSAASRVPVGLATSAPREVIERVVARPELSGCFTVTVSSAEVARGKPSPDVYAAAVSRLHCDPADSFAVEDSSNGIRAASAAGLTVLGLEHQQYPIAPDARALTRAVFTSAGELSAHLMAQLDAR